MKNLLVYIMANRIPYERTINSIKALVSRGIRVYVFFNNCKYETVVEGRKILENTGAEIGTCKEFGHEFSENKRLCIESLIEQGVDLNTFILQLDSDDEIIPESFDTVSFDDESVDLYWSKKYFRAEHGKETQERLICFDENKDDYLSSVLDGQWVLYNVNVIVRLGLMQKAFNSYNYTYDVFDEFLAFVYYAMNVDKSRIKRIDEPYYVYWREPTSLSSAKTADFYYSAFEKLNREVKMKGLNVSKRFIFSKLYYGFLQSGELVNYWKPRFRLYELTSNDAPDYLKSKVENLKSLGLLIE